MLFWVDDNFTNCQTTLDGKKSCGNQTSNPLHFLLNIVVLSAPSWLFSLKAGILFQKEKKKIQTVWGGSRREGKENQTKTNKQQQTPQQVLTNLFSDTQFILIPSIQPLTGNCSLINDTMTVLNQEKVDIKLSIKSCWTPQPRPQNRYHAQRANGALHKHMYKSYQ